DGGRAGAYRHRGGGDDGRGHGVGAGGGWGYRRGARGGGRGWGAGVGGAGRGVDRASQAEHLVRLGVSDTARKRAQAPIGTNIAERAAGVAPDSAPEGGVGAVAPEPLPAGIEVLVGLHL